MLIKVKGKLTHLRHIFDDPNSILVDLIPDLRYKIHDYKDAKIVNEIDKKTNGSLGRIGLIHDELQLSGTSCEKNIKGGSELETRLEEVHAA